MLEALRETLVGIHKQNSTNQIVGPDEVGAFPSSRRNVSPVAVDANELRDQILRLARSSRQTIFVTAVNEGILRSFCAPHVIQDVYDHLEEWAAKQNPVAAALAWESQILPLLRCVDVPTDLNTSAEAARLAMLNDPHSGRGDPDDVPSATLALLLEAPFLCRDKNPLRAVYGDDLDYDDHIDWRSALKAGGDVSVIGQLFDSAGSLGLGSFMGVRAIVRSVPPQYLVTLLGAGGLLWHRLVSEETRRRQITAVGNAAKAVGHGLAAGSMLQAQATQIYESFGVLAEPSLDELRAVLSEEQILARSCLYALARSSESQLSAEVLHARLTRWTEVSHGTAKVRKVLRSRACFTEIYRGQFQLGAMVRADGR